MGKKNGICLYEVSQKVFSVGNLCQSEGDYDVIYCRLISYSETFLFFFTDHERSS